MVARVLQSLKTRLKFVTLTQASKSPLGIAVNFKQPAKHCSNVVALDCVLKRFAGID